MVPYGFVVLLDDQVSNTGKLNDKYVYNIYYLSQVKSMRH